MREHKNPTWRVSEIDITWYRGRDHQVVNPHRDGTIVVDLWTGAANSSRQIRYNFAAGDVLENDLDSSMNRPDDRRVVWPSEILEGGPGVEDIEEIPEEWEEVVNEELEWLGFEVMDEPPEWHYEE